MKNIFHLSLFIPLIDNELYVKMLGNEVRYNVSNVIVRLYI